MTTAEWLESWQKLRQECPDLLRWSQKPSYEEWFGADSVTHDDLVRHDNLGKDLFEQGRFTEAEAAFREVIRLRPDDSGAHYYLGMVLDKEGKPEAAEAEYRETIRLSPDFAEAHQGLGVTLNAKGRHKEAEAEFRQAVRLRPDSASAHYNLGFSLLDQDRFKEAEGAFREAIRLKPDEVNYWSYRAGCAIRLGQWDKAVADLSQAIKLQPGNGEFLAQLGGAYAELGQWQKATAEFDEAMKCKQPHPHAWYLRALLHLRDGKLDRYRSICADMLQRFGKTDDSNNAHFLAWTCILAPNAVANAAQPVHLAAMAVAKEPRKFSCCQTLGAALYRAGRFEDAVKRLTEASTLKPDPKDMRAYNWFFLAMAHRRLGQADKARHWLEKALQETEKALKPSSNPIAGAQVNANHLTGPVPVSWNQKLTLQLLRREAEKQIRGRG